MALITHDRTKANAKRDDRGRAVSMREQLLHKITARRKAGR